MPKRNIRPSKLKSIFLSKKFYKQILIWAQSKNEINFVCFGKGNYVHHVERIRNISRSSQSFAEWSLIELKELKSKHRKYKIIAMGHSHPMAWHDQHPSYADVHFIPTGQIELIAFPMTNEIKAWVIKDTLRETYLSECNISQ